MPEHCYRDGTVDITVNRIKGDYAVCAALEIIEYIGGKGEKSGGAQSAEAGPLPVAYRYELLPCAPNPFDKTTTIKYQLARPGKASLRVYNTLGQMVRTLADGEQQTGHHSVKWDGRDDNGREASAGVYFFRLKAESFENTKRLVLLK
jgi:hypothetical protein